MPSFEKSFIETNGMPIKYKNWEIIRADRIHVPKNFSGTLKIISTNSEWEQAVRLRVFDRKLRDGKLIIDSEEASGFFIWAPEKIDTDGDIHYFEGTTKEMLLLVQNAWKEIPPFGNKFTNSGLHGAAMIVEVNGNTRRYRCNDGHPDDNFDDIVFEVTIDE